MKTGAFSFQHVALGPSVARPESFMTGKLSNHSYKRLGKNRGVFISAFSTSDFSVTTQTTLSPQPRSLRSQYHRSRPLIASSSVIRIGRSQHRSPLRPFKSSLLGLRFACPDLERSVIDERFPLGKIEVYLQPR